MIIRPEFDEVDQQALSLLLDHGLRGLGWQALPAAERLRARLAAADQQARAQQDALLARASSEPIQFTEARDAGAAYG